MAALYWLCLLVGGTLATLSVFSGALDADMGLDMDVDMDGLDADVDAADVFNVDAEGLELDSEAVEAIEGEVEAQADQSGGVGEIFSVRGLIYGTFGFGLIGVLFTEVLAPGRPLYTLIFAVGTGAVASVLITKLVGLIRQTGGGGQRTLPGYTGRSGEVILPLSHEQHGRIRVRRGGKTIEMRALPYSPDLYDSPPEEWEEVYVVEMEDGIARVGPKKGSLPSGGSTE